MKILSNTIEALDGTNLLLLFQRICIETINVNTIIEYNPKFVKLIFKYPNIGAFILIKLSTSNCSNGELINSWPDKVSDLEANDAEEK